MLLPTKEYIDKKEKEGMHLTPLEHFIKYNIPSNRENQKLPIEDEVWVNELKYAIEYCVDVRITDVW
tara:strand:+ start:151 stop:351 length:201 start_codon:yes stop_codon:yes gene_type:complete